MNIEAMGTANLSPPRSNEPAQQVERRRQEPDQELQGSLQSNKTPPEELINQIRAITEDGLYSVRFERDGNTDALIVKVVDSETDEVIRQIPPKELLHLNEQLREMSGNLVDTVR